MRWFITINGEECADPAPIDGVVYTINGSAINIHRSATITGICRGTAAGSLDVGLTTATLNVGMCGGFNETFNAYTGKQTLSTVEVEEMPPRELGGE